MKIVGIICEYNPFHWGHQRQMRLIRGQLGEDTAIVCVMSGNYVQRGEPAMWEKYTRARAAVANGADVVLELPITAVLRSAEGFASEGVRILSQFGAEYLCFGTECGSAEQLWRLAEQVKKDGFQEKLREHLMYGCSYAAARQLALEDSMDLLSKPNNILGFEYCRAIMEQSSPMKPMGILRNGDYHALEAVKEAPSASAVRKLVPDGEWKEYVPLARLWESEPWYTVEFGERAVLARLRSMSDEEWEKAAHGSEGLWSKAMKASRREGSLQDVMDATKSKRYPMSRIRRLLLCAYLGISADDLHTNCPYVRILSAGDRGFKLIRSVKKAGRMVLINPGETPEDRAYYALECRASDLHALFAAPGFDIACGREQAARMSAKKFFEKF